MQIELPFPQRRIIRKRCTLRLASHIRWLVLIEQRPQKDVALIVGISPATVSRVMQGDLFPHVPPSPPSRAPAIVYFR